MQSFVKKLEDLPKLKHLRIEGVGSWEIKTIQAFTNTLKKLDRIKTLRLAGYGDKRAWKTGSGLRDALAEKHHLTSLEIA